MINCMFKDCIHFSHTSCVGGIECYRPINDYKPSPIYDNCPDTIETREMTLGQIQDELGYNVQIIDLTIKEIKEED